MDILIDAESKPWTWVLGEAEGDLPYDEMVRRALQAEEDEQRQKDEEDVRAAQVMQDVKRHQNSGHQNSEELCSDLHESL